MPVKAHKGCRPPRSRHVLFDRVAVLVAVVALVSCTGTSRTPASDSARQQTPAGPTVMDSETTARRAASAFGWGETDAFLVKSYHADSAGVLVRLIRICAPDADCYGAGGTVRVRQDGTTQVESAGGP